MKKVEFIEPKKEPKLVGVKRPAPIIAREDKQQLIELKKKVTKKREKKDDMLSTLRSLLKCCTKL